MAISQIVKDRRGHHVCGNEFQKFLDNFLESYEILDTTAPKQDPCPNPHEYLQEGQGWKRSPEESGPAPGPSPKKLRVTLEASLVCDAESIDKALLSECRVTSDSRSDSLWLQIPAADHIYLLNKNTKEWQGNENFLFGFGKGSFKLLKQDDPALDESIELAYSSSADLVCYNGSLQPLRQILKGMRATNPDTKICYFKIQLDPQDPGVFSLQRTHRVDFIPGAEEKSAELKDFNAGAKEKMTLWERSQSLAVYWYVKHFAVKGLIPVKPGSFLKGAVTIPASKALTLVKP